MKIDNIICKPLYRNKMILVFLYSCNNNIEVEINKKDVLIEFLIIRHEIERNFIKFYNKIIV